MSPKSLIGLLFFLCFSLITTAQTDFVLSLTMPETDDAIYDAHELPDGSFLFAGSTTDNSGKEKPIMIKTDNNGNIQFIRQYDCIGAFKLLIENNGKLYIIGNSNGVQKINSNRIFISELNNDCDTVALTSYLLPDSLELNRIKCIVNTSGDFICSGFFLNKGSDFDYHMYYMYILKMSHDLQKMQFKLFNNVLFCWDMIESAQHDGYYAFIMCFDDLQLVSFINDNISNGLINDNFMLYMDTAFNINWSYHFPNNSLRNTTTVKWVSDTTLIYVCEEFILDDSDRGIGALMFSPQDTTIIKSSYIGVPDTASFPAFRESVVTDNSNNIFIGGMKNIEICNPFWSTNKDWFCLSKFDKQMNPIWTKYYGGDAYYNLWTIKETQDGGCLMLGTRYDYLTQNYERDIYIVRVDENGLITSPNEMPPLTVSEAIVYPNPGSTQLTIETALKDLQFELYNTNGQTVVSQPVNNGTTTVNTSALPAGVYLYRFMNKDKMVESGKWVKE